MNSNSPARSDSLRQFFRQGSWMMIASTMGGGFMFAVHLLNQKIPAHEYGALGSLLALVLWIQMPTCGVQPVFAHQTAAAVSDDQRRQLAGAVRTAAGAALLVWGLMALVTLSFQQSILDTLKIPSAAALWVTLLLGLISLWQPIFTGVLQGVENFLWMGWAQVLNGFGRFAVAVLFVFVLKSYAAGIMMGALLGAVPALGIAIWHSRSVWMAVRAPVNWKPWLRRIVPLTMAMSSTQFLLTTDVLMVASFSVSENPALYVPLATMGRALIMFTGPLSVMMFPKIVRSFVRSEKTDALSLTLISTALAGITFALALTVLAKPLFKIAFPNYLAVAPLIGLYSWCVLPQALAVVLMNNLLAKEDYRVTPWTLVVVAGYFTALVFWHNSFEQVIAVLGIFSVLFLLVNALFFWLHQRRIPTAA